MLCWRADIEHLAVPEKSRRAPSGVDPEINTGFGFEQAGRENGNRTATKAKAFLSPVPLLILFATSTLGLIQGDSVRAEGYGSMPRILSH